MLLTSITDSEMIFNASSDSLSVHLTMLKHSVTMSTHYTAKNPCTVIGSCLLGSTSGALTINIG